jgi:hypothetical protein
VLLDHGEPRSRKVLATALASLPVLRSGPMAASYLALPMTRAVRVDDLDAVSARNDDCDQHEAPEETGEHAHSLQSRMKRSTEWEKVEQTAGRQSFDPAGLPFHHPSMKCVSFAILMLATGCVTSSKQKITVETDAAHPG